MSSEGAQGEGLHTAGSSVGRASASIELKDRKRCERGDFCQRGERLAAGSARPGGIGRGVGSWGKDPWRIDSKGPVERSKTERETVTKT